MAGRVLCVDDDRALCQIVAKALAGEGYEVRTAFDGEDALAAIREEPPDLVLLDLMLPGLDGFQVLEAIRALDAPERGLPVVLISGCTTTPIYAERANTLRAVDLLTKPVPLETFIRVVAEQIGEAKPPAPLRDKAKVERNKSFSGTLDRLPFPSVIHHLHGMRATGILHITSGKKRKWLQLRDGYPVAVRSNLVRETLGHFLVRTGRITQAVFDECMQYMGKGKRQGEILIAMDVLSEQEVAEVLREQADEKFLEIFSWESGSFRFERAQSLPRANDLGLDRSPADLILEGVRTRFPLARIDHFFEKNAGLRVARGENLFNRFQNVRVDGSEEARLRELDGSQCLGDLHSERESFRRTVYALIAAGILELQEPGAAAAQPPRASRANSPASARARGAAAPRKGPRRGIDPRQEDERHLALVKLAEEIRGKSYFELFGVDETVDEQVLRDAYESLSAQVHPDRFSAASMALRDLADELHEIVKNAYDTLLKPRERRQYVLEEQKREREAAKRRKSELALEAESEFRKGEGALDVRDYETALAHFGRALQLYPHEGDHHAHYGWALYLCHPGDPSMVGEALEHVKRGLKLASHREKPYLFLGRLYKAIGRVEMAEKMFARAVQVQPDCVEALRELRLINMRRQKSKGLIGRILRR
ncbi:MAG: response regulator [Myxococcales bacterium]|nr:response regulator [Myxococcales bacterium]